MDAVTAGSPHSEVDTRGSRGPRTREPVLRAVLSLAQRLVVALTLRLAPVVRQVDFVGVQERHLCVMSTSSFWSFTLRCRRSATVTRVAVTPEAIRQIRKKCRMTDFAIKLMGTDLIVAMVASCCQLLRWPPECRCEVPC